MTKQAHYRHDLGGELYFDAFAVDPELDESGLVEFVNSRAKDSLIKPDSEKLARDFHSVAHLGSFDELKVEVSDQPYEVPEALKPYRDAGRILYDKTMFNGPIAIVDSPVQIPVRIRPGGYYDFKATEHGADPAKTLTELLNGNPEDLFINTFRCAGTEEKFRARYNPELVSRFRAQSLAEFLEAQGFSEAERKLFDRKTVGELLETQGELFSRAFDIEAREIRGLQRAQYSPGTLEQVMPELGITNDQRARYLGFAFMMQPGNGREISLVQRAKGLGIAADCISSSGGTPPFQKEFLTPGFDFPKFYTDEVKKEMGEEYNLEQGEFDIGGVYLIDERKQIPFGAVEITTPATTAELAQRIYGKKDAIKEHPILYGMPIEATESFLNRFEIFPAIRFALGLIDKKGS